VRGRFSPFPTEKPVGR